MPTEYIMELSAPEDTIFLGHVLAKSLTDFPEVALLLFGDLGAGKTTLVRGFAAALPGGEQAEVASPSFNIYNLYPTSPEIAHVDLYRLEGMGLDDDLLDLLFSEHVIAIIEWAEHLTESATPADFISLTWSALQPKRTVCVHSRGETASKVLDCAMKDLDRFLK